MRNFDKPLRTTAWSSTRRILIVIYAPLFASEKDKEIYKTFNLRFGSAVHVTETQVPEPRLLVTLKSAPIASARSRMIRIPRLVGLVVDISKPIPLSEVSK